MSLTNSEETIDRLKQMYKLKKLSMKRISRKLALFKEKNN